MSLVRLNVASWAWHIAGDVYSSQLIFIGTNMKRQLASPFVQSCTRCLIFWNFMLVHVYMNFLSYDAKWQNRPIERGYVGGPMRKLKNCQYTIQTIWHAKYTLHATFAVFCHYWYISFIQAKDFRVSTATVVLQLLQDTQSSSELPQLPTLCCPWHSGQRDLSVFAPMAHSVCCPLET